MLRIGEFPFEVESEVVPITFRRVTGDFSTVFHEELTTDFFERSRA